MHKIFQPLLILIVLMMTGCSVLTVYEPEVSQGNSLTPAQIAQLKPGMSKGEVRFLLGSPILQNTFEKNRWDYVYTLKKQGQLVENKHLSLYFDKDRLSDIKQGA